MRILIYTQAGKDIGMGHIYRCKVLAEEAEHAGHRVRLASNLGPMKVIGMPSGPRLALLFAEFLPDVIIFDLPYKLDTYITELCHSYKIQVVSLLQEYGPDIIFAQDRASNMILRPELTQLKGKTNSDMWLVFGGSFDPMNLVKHFREYGQEKAWLITNSQDRNRIPGQLNISPGDSLPEYIRSCNKACVGFGMISWEIAACGKPQYVFSLDQEHLDTAITLQESGLALVWPKVGLPGPQDFKDFLKKEFVPYGSRPDGNGALRLLRLLEE